MAKGKSMVMQPKYRMRVERDRAKYNRKEGWKMEDEFWDMGVEEAMGYGFDPDGDDVGGDLPTDEGECN